MAGHVDDRRRPTLNPPKKAQNSAARRGVARQTARCFNIGGHKFVSHFAILQCLVIQDTGGGPFGAGMKNYMIGDDFVLQYSEVSV